MTADTVTSRRLVAVIVLSLLTITGGTALAWWATTGGGDIAVDSAAFETESGVDLRATVHEPPNASADDPAPAVLLVHGFTDEQATMASLATEFADRGYVAVTVDQPGHGASDPPAFVDGWGGPAALAFTRGLASVDGDRVAMVGHSMGGFASLAAARDQPDGYTAVVLLGSTWGPIAGLGSTAADIGLDQLPAANATFPRNMAVAVATFDEFSPYMYDKAVPGDVDQGEKLAAAFGTEPPVEHGRTYGSVEDGTARRFTAPRTIHTGMHRSTAVAENTIAWVERTTGDAAVDDSETAGATVGGDATGPTASEQHWYWATLGHVVAFFGAVVLVTAATALAWRRVPGTHPGEGGSTAGTRSGDGNPTAGTRSGDGNPTAGTRSGDGNPTAGTRPGQSGRAARTRPDDHPWHTGTRPSGRQSLAVSIIPALALYPLYGLGAVAIPVTRLTHQELSNAFVAWALGSVLLVAGFHRWQDEMVVWREWVADWRARAPERAAAVRGLAAALVGIGLLYAVVSLVALVPGGEVRTWLAGLGPLTPARWFSVAVYVVPMAVAVLVLSYGLAGSDRGGSLLRDVGRAVAVTCSGLAVFLAIQYLPLVLGFGMLVPALGPLAIVGLRTLFGLAVVTAVATATTALTDSPLPGGLAAGLLATWLLVGHGPIHVAPF